jgi:hypothetical protein
VPCGHIAHRNVVENARTTCASDWRRLNDISNGNTCLGARQNTCVELETLQFSTRWIVVLKTQSEIRLATNLRFPSVPRVIVNTSHPTMLLTTDIGDCWPTCPEEWVLKVMYPFLYISIYSSFLCAVLFLHTYPAVIDHILRWAIRFVSVSIRTLFLRWQACSGKKSCYWYVQTACTLESIYIISASTVQPTLNFNLLNHLKMRCFVSHKRHHFMIGEQ